MARIRASLNYAYKGMLPIGIVLMWILMFFLLLASPLSLLLFIEIYQQFWGQYFKL